MGKNTQKINLHNFVLLFILSRESREDSALQRPCREINICRNPRIRLLENRVVHGIPPDEQNRKGSV